jgi:alanine-glyoxylate transaminase/serine-glyoxylate transaminase/serine-pyruvate transaminase
VTGTQKGLMLPAGLGILGASQKAIEASKTCTSRRVFYDFKDMLAMNANGYFPHTPPTQLLHGMRKSVDRILGEGLENVFARHARLAEGVRRGIAAWGLELCAENPSLYSNTVSAIKTGDVDAREVLRIAYTRYNTSFGSGLARLAGKVFRIGHLGDLNEGMTLTALSIAEASLAEAGVKIEFGSGVGAALAWYTEGRIPAATRIAAE